MRFTLFEPTAVSPHDVLHLAVEAERCGFDTFAINDGTFQMRDTVGVYPYSPDHRRNWDLATPFYEPMTMLPAIAVRTSRIRLLTKVVKLPLHHPLILAKQVATLAVLSGDRFALGVGSSWAPEEYRFVGADWARRGRLVEESIEALRLVLSGEVVAYHGELIDFDELIARPAPRKPVRILLGGHHEPSLRRAARLTDGWVAAGPPTMDELRPIIRRLRELCDEAGRDWSSFEVHAYPNDVVTLADYRRLEELGVTDAATLPINTGTGRALDASTRQRLAGRRVEAADDADRLYSEEPPRLKLDTIRRFADTIMSHWKTS
jgi:probable F420-dependent oxidoreductase